MSKYFSEKEFNRCNPPCSERDMDPIFLTVLDGIREQAGIPLLLSCAYRSVEHDIKKGRSGNSAHTKGKAVDIVCNNSSTRMKIVEAVLKCGIRRIGNGKNFVHIDCDKTLPQDVMFDYYD